MTEPVLVTILDTSSSGFLRPDTFFISTSIEGKNLTSSPWLKLNVY